MPQINETITINEVVRQLPESMKIFSRHNLDTCCGGWQQIGPAAQQAGADLNALLAELRALAAEQRR